MADRIKNVEIVCNLKYIDKKTGEVKIFDIKEAEAILLKKITAGSIIQYVYCVHNKDTYTIEDEEKNPKHKKGSPKEDHIHIFIKLKEGRSFKDIGKWFGLESNFVNKCKTQFDNACLYAIHANAPEKYQYDIEEAVTSPGFDYSALVNAKKTKYVKEKNKDKQYQRKMEIVSLIDQGVINQINLSQYVTCEEEVTFSNAIKIAFDRKHRDMSLITEKQMSGIYICGASGTAKTTLAKMIAYSQGFSFGISGSNRDPAQEYKNQDCYILDDISPTSFDWKEFLKLADNNTASAIGSRNKDKLFSNCKLLILTHTKEPRDFVDLVQGSTAEEKKQFYRRFKTMYKLKNDNIDIYKYNEKNDRYEFIETVRNKALDYINFLKAKNPQQQNYTDLNSIFDNFFNRKNVIILDTAKYDKQDKECSPALADPDEIFDTQSEDVFRLGEPERLADLLEMSDMK